MIEVTVTVLIKKKKTPEKRFCRTIQMPFIPYIGTTLALRVGNSSSYTIYSLTVETLIWRETNETEKIGVYGTIRDGYGDKLSAFEKSSEWKAS